VIADIQPVQSVHVYACTADGCNKPRMQFEMALLQITVTNSFLQMSFIPFIVDFYHV